MIIEAESRKRNITKALYFEILHRLFVPLEMELLDFQAWMRSTWYLQGNITWATILHQFYISGIRSPDIIARNDS